MAKLNPGYCEKCEEYKEEIIVPGRLMASTNLDPLFYIDFVVSGDSISRLTVKPTESCKEDAEKIGIVDLTIKVTEFCVSLDRADCPDCGMPVLVPWIER